MIFNQINFVWSTVIIAVSCIITWAILIHIKIEATPSLKKCHPGESGNNGVAGKNGQECVPCTNGKDFSDQGSRGLEGLQGQRGDKGNIGIPGIPSDAPILGVAFLNTQIVGNNSKDFISYHYSNVSHTITSQFTIYNRSIYSGQWLLFGTVSLAKVPNHKLIIGNIFKINEQNEGTPGVALFTPSNGSNIADLRIFNINRRSTTIPLSAGTTYYCTIQWTA